MSLVRKEDVLSPCQFQRPDQPKLPDGRSNSLSEDHHNINDVANVLERPRLKGATSIPIPNDTSTTCRISWCGGVERKTKSRRTTGQFISRGGLLSLQKRAQQSKILRGEAALVEEACVGEAEMEQYTPTARMSMSDQHQTLQGSSHGTVRRSTGDGGKFGVFAADVLLRSVRTVEMRKELRCQLRPFLAVSAMVMARTVKRCLRSRAVDVRCVKAWAELAFIPFGVVFSQLVATGAVRSARRITGNSTTEQVLLLRRP